MSFLNKLLGKKKKKAQTPSLPEAIRKLKLTEENLQRRQNYLEEKVQKEIATARRHASANKKVALQAIQRKKRFERQLQQVDGALTTLEAQRDILENANTNTLAVDSMEKASKALKAAHKDVDVDKVEKILSDLEEQKDITNEITEAISQPVAFGDNNLDEEELERELEELTGHLQELDVHKLPSVPQTDLKKEDNKENRKEKANAAAI